MLTTLWLALAVAADPIPLAIEHLTADPVDGAVRVRWTTPAPTRCEVEYGTADLSASQPEPTADLRGSTNAGNDSGAGYANNHRVDLPLPAQWPLRYRIVAEAADGRRLTTEPATVTAPPPVVPTVARARVPIRLSQAPVPGQPVILGMPFPAGHLTGADQVRMLVEERELPIQAEVVSRWPDRSVKWLRVSFAPPPAAAAAVVEYGRDVRAKTAPSLAIGVAADGRSFTADAGALRASAAVLQAGGTTLGFPRPVLTATDGQERPGVVRHVALEEAGPVRAVVRIDGDFGTSDQPGFRYVQRLHLFADAPWARVDFTFVNEDTSTELSRFRSLRLDVGPMDGQVAVGIPPEQTALAVGQRALQREDSEWTLGPADGPAAVKGKRLAGVATGPGVSVGVRDFWQQYPCAFSRTADGLAVELYPPLPAGCYANRPDEEKLYAYLRTGQYEFRQGFSKTHELWLDLSGRALAGPLVADPPLAVAPAEWIENSRAMRDLAVACRDQFPQFDERQQAAIDRYLEVRDRAREYGLMHFGDWFGERTWNWGNLEYDLGHAFLMLYARSGYPAFFHRATEVVRHQRDVDTRHAASDPRRVGQQWTHSMVHTAGYYPRNHKDMEIYASPGWSDNRGHIWAQGLFEQYLLGGDRRSWETGRLVADWAAGPQTTNFRFFNAREPGWMLILVMGAYNATGDPFYLNGARLMIREVQRLSEATGNRGFHYHGLPGGHCDCAEKHFGEAGFMLGVQMTGLKMAYEQLGDERIADDIVKTARFIVETMYDPQQRGFRYTSCPRTGVSGGSVFIELEGLAFAAARTGDPKLLAVVREAVAAAWDQIAGAGKSAGYQLCSLPQGLTQFARLPGESLAAQYEAAQRWLRSPARRPTPALVPNGDFETDAAGWAPRAGVTVERVTDEAHSGAACLKLVARCTGQNEYLNTRYDTSSDPFEIRWLQPGRTYRFTAWLKVARLSAGTPGPNLRVQLRDAAGSRTSVGTNAYDLTRLGTWQKLTADVPVPEWNTRNYLALNTNRREAVEGELYLDDVSLVPVEQATQDTYRYVRLLPATATGGLSVRDVRGEAWLSGPGTATWPVTAPAGRYRLWLKLDGSTAGGATVRLGATTIATIGGPGEAAWVGGDTVALPAAATLAVDLRAETLLGAVVLTDDPSEPRWTGTESVPR